MNVDIKNVRLQTSLYRPLCANGDYLISTKFTQLQLGAFKTVIFRSTSLKMGSLNQKLYVDFKNGFNLENPITSESVYPYTKMCKRRLSYFYQITPLQLETLGAYKIVIFRSTSKKFGSLIRKLYVNFKNGLNLENPITNESVDPYSPFFETPCI